jgi:hypothetical protein
MHLLPYISQQPEDTLYEGMVHKRDTLWAQDILPQGSAGAGRVDILPLPSDTWSSLKSRDSALEWMFLGRNCLNQERVDIHSLGYNYSYQVKRGMVE